jgi:hypothetical protein
MNILDSSLKQWENRAAPEYLDIRSVVYRVAREAPLRVPDLVLSCVGYVAELCGSTMSTDAVDPIATTFIVSSSIPNVVGVRVFYAVTAAHALKSLADESNLVIVVNKKGGGVCFIPTFFGAFRHPDDTVDVAVIPVKYDPSFDITAFDIEDFFDEANNPENIGPGDEVFFPGLFTPAPGIDRVTPLVRHGNIAMIPKQQIQTSEGYQDIYLIEARSIGGLSGSPVFARETVVLPASRESGQVNMHGLGVFKLLGLIKAHWDVDENKINQAHVLHDPKRGVNLGIAQVVPANKIKETINGPALSAIRESAARSYLSMRCPSND